MEGYTKADLVNYYEGIARWMLPYLKDRPVMVVRYPDGKTTRLTNVPADQIVDVP